MPIDVKNLDKPTRFYWLDDPGGKEWIELRLLGRGQTVELLKKANIKQTAEYKVNPTTKQYERITFIDTNFDKDMLFGDLMLDATIIDWNFTTPEGEVIPCTKENKILLGGDAKFRGWVDDCLEIMREGKKKADEEEEKN